MKGINYKALSLESKFCKQKGYYFNLLVPIDITEDNYLDYATPFKFGYSNKRNNGEQLVSGIRTVGDEIVIHTYREFDYKADDVIRIDDKFYHIQDVFINYNESEYVNVKHFYITLR